MKLKRWTVFFIIACIGWIAGVIVHVSSIFGYIPGKYIFILHVGIFVVWLPFIVRLKAENPAPENRSSIFGRRTNLTFKVLFRHAPMWMRVIAIAGFFYSLVNFILFASHDTRTLSTQLTALTVRGFSGHWMFFYGVAAAGLYPARNTIENNPG